MKIICAWCGKVLQDGPPPVSHGICPKCAAELLVTIPNGVPVMPPNPGRPTCKAH